MKVLGIFIVCLLVFGLYYRQSQSEYLSIRQNVPWKQKEAVFKKLLDVTTLCAKKSKTRPFMIYGTLLGYYRDRKFICYDHDLDFGILEKEFDVFIAELKNFVKSHGDFELEEKYFAGYKAAALLHVPSQLNADFTLFNDKGETISRAVPSLYSTMYLGECASEYPRNVILPLQQVDFVGHNIHIPNDPATLLRCYYGDNFETPDHKCNEDCTLCVPV